MGRMEEAANRPAIHEIAQFSHTIEEQQERIMTLVAGTAFGKPRPSFTDLFAPCVTRLHAIVTFLGLLELLNARTVRLVAGEGVNNFWLEGVLGEEEE